jgi:hypothetical protein
MLNAIPNIVCPVRDAFIVSQPFARLDEPMANEHPYRDRNTPPIFTNEDGILLVEYAIFAEF